MFCMIEKLTFDWPSLVVGGIIGYLCTRILGKPLDLMETRASNYVKRKLCSPPSKKDPEYFKLGTFETQFLIIDGNGEYEYEPENIVCRVENKPMNLPPEVIRLYDEIEQEQKNKEERGDPFEWNGPFWALEKHNVTRTTPNERMKLILTLRKSDYFTFRATVLSLDKNLADQPRGLTLRQKYLQGRDPRDLGNNPIVFLANGIGVALLAITKDKKALIARRAETVGPRPGQLDVSVAEGLNPERDGKDFFRAAYSGINEELGVKPSDTSVALLGFGVDMKYYQWIMIGVARVNKTAQEVLEGRSRGTMGKWENREFYPIDIDLKTILTYLKDREMWDTAWVTLYWALVYEWGKGKVDSVWKKILG